MKSAVMRCKGLVAVLVVASAWAACGDSGPGIAGPSDAVVDAPVDGVAPDAFDDVQDDPDLPPADIPGNPDATGDTADLPAGPDATDVPRPDASGGLAILDLKVESASIGLAVNVTFRTSVPALGSALAVTDGQPVRVRTGSSQPVTEHRVLLTGLHPDRTYRIRGRAVADTQEAESEVAWEWVSGPLPEDFPVIDFELLVPGHAMPGYTLFSLSRVGLDGTGVPTPDFLPTLVAVDPEGEVSWYLRMLESGTQQGFSMLPDGNVGVVGDFGLAEFTLEGEKVREVGTAALDVPTLHHDVVRLPGGNFVSLTLELQPQPDSGTPPQAFLVDVLIEFTPDGRVVRRHAMDQFLPFDPANTPTNNVNQWNYLFPGYRTVDVYHANSLNYDATSDLLIVGLLQWGQILVLDGTTWDVLGVLGEGGTVELAKGDWFRSTHGPHVLPNGNIVVYDNGGHLQGGFEPSRAMEYRLEPVEPNPNAKRVWTMAATEVWSYQNDFFSPFMGNVQRLDDGSTLICDGLRLVPGDGGMATEPYIQRIGTSPSKPISRLTIRRRADDTLPSQWIVYRAYRIQNL